VFDSFGFVVSLRPDDPLAQQVVLAIKQGSPEELQALLDRHPGLAAGRLVGGSPSVWDGRTLLHVVTDWPGHVPGAGAKVTALAAAGADVDAASSGGHSETPLHWAASADDVEALEALLDAGADIDAPGAVIGGGTPLDDAVAFAQWAAARRLVERGARVNLWNAAALGLLDRVRALCQATALPPPSEDELTNALWCACHGGQAAAADELLARGADLNWVGHDGLTPLDAARRSGADELADRLAARGAKTADEARAAG
jgi:ankyrin repeat protein